MTRPFVILLNDMGLIRIHAETTIIVGLFIVNGWLKVNTTTTGSNFIQELSILECYKTIPNKLNCSDFKRQRPYLESTVLDLTREKLINYDKY